MGCTGTIPGFSDVHSLNMRMAEYNGLTTGLVGFGPGWDPWAKATRAEVAQLLWNLWQRGEGQTWVSSKKNPDVSQRFSKCVRRDSNHRPSDSSPLVFRPAAVIGSKVAVPTTHPNGGEWRIRSQLPCGRKVTFCAPGGKRSGSTRSRCAETQPNRVRRGRTCPPHHEPVRQEPALVQVLGAVGVL